MKRINALIWVLFLLVACSSNTTVETPTEESPILSVTPSFTSTPVFTPTPQPHSLPITYGPDRENFPANVNPLSGLQVEDPSLLQTPAMALSISNFPVAARPQAGLSFAPWVFEFYITEGATRFLSMFYGKFPEPDVPITGDCEVRREPVHGNNIQIGNRIWLDENQNGIQEDFEQGVGGVCINLLNSAGKPIWQTTSDSNGYYGFGAEPGRYIVEVKLPAWLKFTKPNLGDEEHDSDADSTSGKIEADLQSTPLDLDIGLIPSEEANPPVNPSAPIPAAEVGPIRSGRMLYVDVHNMFLNSCFVFASASEEILPLLPQCYLVPHDEASGGAMLSIEKMKSLAQENKDSRTGEFNYASNVFSETPPSGGEKAIGLNSYVALLNQSAWVYDLASNSYWRYVDDTTQENAGVLHPEIDRLTGRQLQFNNIIVLEVDQEVYEYQGRAIRTLLDYHLELGQGGYAYLFRDGMKYNIRWTTKARVYEKETGQARPFYFVDANGDPVSLRPGNTWFIVATPYSYFSSEDGVWDFRFVPPEGVK
ncbi:MAG: SdrD B-like domain-containing protein [Anaerolineales bacterium]